MEAHQRNRQDWPDAALLLAIAKGDGASFAAFYRRHVPSVLAYLLRQTRNRETAADLAAEVFAAVLLSAERYSEQTDSASAWVIAIARNKLLMSLRRGRVEAQARRRLGFQAVALDDADLTTTAGANWTVQPVPGPVVALAIRRRTVWALGCPHRNNAQCSAVLARKVAPRARWHRVGLPKLVVTMAGRWRISAPRWMGRPCNGFGLTSAAASDWWIICIGAAAAGASTKALLHTSDGGRTWRIESQVTRLTAPQRGPGAITLAEPNALAAGSPRRLWLALQNGLAESADAGRTWSYVGGVDPQGMPAAFDVLSPTRAWLLAAGHGIWRTSDGRHWQAL